MDPKRIDSALTDALSRGFGGGLAAAVTWPGGSHVTAQGLADPRTLRAAAPSTPFHLGAVSEAVTATLLGVLAAKEYVSLGSTARSLLPKDVPVPRDAAGRELTLYHLATHTAGLPEGEGSYGSVAALGAALAAATAEGEAGKRWSLSRLGRATLEQALACAMHRPFPELVRDFVLAPLGCSAATRLGAGGELIASAADLALFLDLHLTGFKWRCLGFNNLAELRRLHEPTLHWEGGGAALGWRVTRCPRLGDCLWQAGTSPGGAGWIGFAPAARVGAAVLADGSGTGLESLGNSLLRSAADGAPGRLRTALGERSATG